MNTYWFEIFLKSHPQSGIELAEQAYEAGCDDGLCGETNGITKISFAREAKALDLAVSSAIRQLESIGCVIDQIQIVETPAPLHEVV